MSQFELENAIREVTRMDSSLNLSKTVGHKPRKVLDNTITDLNLSTTGSRQKSPSRLGLVGTNGGLKRLSTSLRKTPSKSARKSPSRLGTPGREGSATPGGGDRFIPNRSAIDFDTSHYKLIREESSSSANSSEVLSPSKREYQRIMKDNLAGELSSTRVLSYQTKPSGPPDSHSNNLKILYSASKSQQSSKKVARHIPQAPERILDAPDIINDYYLNLVDWSSNNHLAVALGAHVYLWNAATGDIHQLCQLGGEEDYVASVKWVEEGSYLALGTSTGNIQLWDVEQSRMLRVLEGLDSRVASLSWNKWLLAGGSRSGQIQQSDTRVASHVLASVQAHSQEVCGLSWAPDGKYLASGGNDNVLNIWPTQLNSLHTSNTPLHSLTSHQAAVKALAWCPWQSNILASGGGTADRTIKIWNASNGQMLSSTDTKSQVCSLVWANEYRELVSSHGYVNNEIIIWKYPTMEKTAELLGHTERVLHLSLSPDGSTVMSAGADETLRLWRCFAPDPNKKKEARNKIKPSGLRQGIR